MSGFNIDVIPFAKSMGVEILEARKERVRGRMRVTAELCTSGGILHGGASMAFADSLGAIGGHLALPKDAKGTTTLESKTNFLGSAPLDAFVVGETTPVHIGRRTSVWQTMIRTEDGKPVALVTQTQMALGI